METGLCFPTFGGPSGPQVVNGPQDEPQGLLLLPRHSQDLHGRLELGELLRRSLLLLGLRRSRVNGRLKDADGPCGRGSPWRGGGSRRRSSQLGG